MTRIAFPETNPGKKDQAGSTPVKETVTTRHSALVQEYPCHQIMKSNSMKQPNSTWILKPSVTTVAA